MQFTIVTLFPEFFDSALGCGLMAKANESGLVSFAFKNPREFTTDKHHTVDDRPYGGGPGMVMMADPLAKTLRSIQESSGKPGRILMMAPKGRPFTQAMARELAQEESVTIICGRYEGFDARLEELFAIEPVSIGDYVLNGGETAALSVIEATSRLVPGYMGHEDSGEEESFSAGLLEYPHYTRPDVFEGLEVPEILKSGDHKRIAEWRREQALKITLHNRPDILQEAPLSSNDLEILKKEDRNRVGRNLFCALVHYPVVNKEKKSVAVSLTNLDIHDIGRCSCTYGLGGYYISTPIEDQRRMLDELLRHWVTGPGTAANPDRGEALQIIRGVGYIEDAVRDISERTGQKPLLVATSAKGAGNMNFADIRHILAERPVLLLFGTAHGLAPQVLEECDGILRPVRYLDGYNHLSVRTAAAIIIDRILGDAL
ncbi:tRNA (guanosine(37)-N1)-methyltransferase TrmD [Desulfovibrio mangrovi]|uniref:tRNA (guanosine(37)-N1)-methyltransferase TrmD n=1 Tax=Desulfovibrio mangrovi TaxID=2976983 RepID=UPI002247C974|nr:tRNA (guanosine(37)-N1)-methyltransferase TrmD [Desulfovibrio mangrovi]UZP67220.1 tRNA (guanosine(37)-N1)-methyltransferase TrmD [Desulfovibrio mangrovi]